MLVTSLEYALLAYKLCGIAVKVAHEEQMHLHFALYIRLNVCFLKRLNLGLLSVPVSRLLIGMADFKQQIFTEDIAN